MKWCAQCRRKSAEKGEDYDFFDLGWDDQHDRDDQDEDNSEEGLAGMKWDVYHGWYLD